MTTKITAENTSFWNPVEFLKKTHTKVLMNWCKSIYRIYSREFEHEYTDEQRRFEISGDPSGDGQRWITMTQLKAELAAREHIPNKAEAKVLRQQRAHAGKNR